VEWDWTRNQSAKLTAGTGWVELSPNPLSGTVLHALVSQTLLFAAQTVHLQRKQGEYLVA